MPSLSVVIPTFNNAATIQAVLEAVVAQARRPEWGYEVIISDDGSTDPTLAILPKSLSPAWPFRVVRGSHRGAAFARNAGVSQARGDVVLFLGADILLRPGALLAHVDFHAGHPAELAAALGFVRWDPRLYPSALMEWMTHGGQQNDYDALLGETDASPSHFWYGSHLSVKKAAVRHEPFSSVFTQYGWEDLELGRRLERRGVRLHVLHEARALHAHYYSVAAVCQRQRALGVGLKIFQELHPTAQLLPAPRSGRWALYFLVTGSGLAWLLRLYLNCTVTWWATPRLFQQLTAYYFWKGVYTRHHVAEPAMSQ